MNKLFTKIAGLAMGLAMAIGVGVAVSSNSDASRVDATAYTGTVAMGSAEGSWNPGETDGWGSSSPAQSSFTDDLNNVWTVEYSYTSYSTTLNSLYFQFGSGKKPATSVVFTTTLSQSQTISDFSANLGGFSGTAGTVTLKVGNTTVGTGSLNAGNDVTVSATNKSTSGTDLSISITSISKGIKVYGFSYTYNVDDGKKDVTLSLGEASNAMEIGDEQQLTVTATSNSATVSGLTYTYVSSNTDVATVSDSGLISAVAMGTTTITVTSAANNTYNAGSVELNLTVTDPNVAAILDFPVAGQTEVSGYDTSFTATNNNHTFTISGANNNNNNWTYIGIGRKNTSSTATIVSNSAFSERVTSVVLVFSAYASAYLDSATLYVANNSSFTSAYSKEFKSSITTSENVVLSIPNANSATNMYYKLEFVCNGDNESNNGYIHLDQIIYRADPVDELQSLAVTGDIPSYTAGSAFTFNRTVTATYSISGNTVVDSGLTFTLGGSAIEVGNTIPVSLVGNAQPLVVTYTDANENSVSAASYNVVVNYKAVTSVTLNHTEANLYLSGTIELTATVADEYADQTVSWSSSDPAVASVSAASGASITVTGEGAGSATITATAGAQSTTCEVTVTAEQVLNILDFNSSIITNTTIDVFTGDEDYYLSADSHNVDNPSFSWVSSNTNVATVASADEMATVTFVGAGSTDVSVTVGSMTKKVTFEVAQSGVTALTLTSSVDGGEIYDGDYNNTLTLTPSVTVVGNATKVINWSSSDETVATVSSAQTTDAAITVTGAGEGTATITAASAYTPAQSVEYVVTVNAEGVKQLTWASKPNLSSGIYGNETTLGDAITAGGGYGTFTAKWNSGKADTHPEFGTGEGTVHFALYDSTTPTEEGTPLTASYVFQNSDNGKYIVPFYEGKRCSYNVQVTVTKWRSVIVGETVSGCYDFSTMTSSSGSVLNANQINACWSSSDNVAAPSISDITKLYGQAGYLGFGSSKNAGSMTLTFAKEITEIEIAYTTWDATTIQITNCTNISIGSEASPVSRTLSVASTSITIHTDNRLKINSINITFGAQELGKTSDCLGLETFIDNYLHWEDYHNDHVEGDTTGDGSCTSYYYGDSNNGAKAAFNDLNENQREIFCTNSAYSAEYKRLRDWAKANGEDINASYQLSSARIVPFSSVQGTSSVALITVITLIGVTSLSGFYFLRKRKEQE